MTRVYSPEEIELLREYDLRSSALSCPRRYAKWMRSSGLPFFEHDPMHFHQVVLDALEALERGDIQRLMITMPPGSAKSTWANIVFLTWYAARHPDHDILAISANQSLAEDFARKRRQAMTAPEWTQLSGVQLDSTRTSVQHFLYGNGGSQLAAGVGSSIVGRRAEILLTDDGVASLEQVSSPARRESMYQWYLSEARTRLRPFTKARGGREIMIGTRWWADDLQGRLLEDEPNDWHLIELPMECVDPTTDAAGRTYVGQPLWPERFHQQQIDENKRDSVRWQSLYQQRPLDAAGDWLDPEAIKVHDTTPPRDELSIYCAADLSTSDSAKSDYTVIGIVGVDHERNIWILDWIRKRMNPEDVVTKLREIRTDWNPIEYLIDNDLGSKFFARLAKTMALQSGSIIVPREVPTGGKSKLERAITFQGLARLGCIRTKNGSWVGELKREISTFPREGSGYFDDQIDTLSLTCNYLFRMSKGAAPQVQTKPEPIKGGITITDGVMHTTETLSELVSHHEEKLSLSCSRIRRIRRI